MAYDLLLRKRTTANWSRCPSLGFRGLFLLTEYEFAPDPTPATDEEKQFIAKLAVLKMSADAGNKKAAKEWKATLAKLDLVRKKAAQGDEKSKHLVVVLKESGIFDGVQAMSVTGDDATNDNELERLMLQALPWHDTRSPEQVQKSIAYKKRWDTLESLYMVSRKDPGSRERKILNDLVKKAKSGDPQAREDVSALLRIRYHAGDAKNYPGSSLSMGDDVSPELQGRRAARKILDDAVDAKSIARADLKKAIWLYAGKQSTEAERASVSGIGRGEAVIAIPAFYGADPGIILAWPIIALIEYFQSRSATAEARSAAARAVNEAISKGLTSGDDFVNAVYLTFGWSANYGSVKNDPRWKYNHQVDDGVPEVRTSVIKRVRAGDPKAIAFYKAVLQTGYTPSKKDPGLAQMSGDDAPPELQGRREARKILDNAVDAKSIGRTDLKRAIWLHAGSQSTEAERAAVGGKMLDFLNKRQVKLSS